MDKYNVISITNNLAELQNDMVNWSNLPYDFRLRSDENCIRLYGMTNTELFNRLRAVLVSTQKPEEDIDVIGANISEAFTSTEDQINYDNPEFSEETEMMKWKKDIANELDKSPYIVIISPFEDNKKKEYGMEELDEKIKKYNLLTSKNKLLSDSYSTDLWGYDVQNMYYIMKRIIANADEESNVDFDFYNRIQSSSKAENPILPVIQNMQEKVLEEDYLGLLSIKLDSTQIPNPVQKAFYETKIIPKIDEYLNEDDFSIPKVVPYFTPSEINEMGIEIENIGTKYSSELTNRMRLFEKGELDESKILSIGWNPSVSITEANLKFAKERQIRWFREYGCKIIDITKWNPDVILNETSEKMSNVYKQKNLYPIYIVLSFTNTPFGKVINKIKHSTYSHAGISINSDLRTIYTFKFEKGTNGFGIESLDHYLRNYEDASISVMTLFVDKAVVDKLKDIFSKFDSIKNRTKYGFSNLFNILINKAVNKGVSMSMVCSQFVDTVLKLVNIDLNNKSSNLVIPQDFINIKHSKVFKTYEGYVKDYKEKNMESYILRLLSLTSTNDVKYSSVVEAVCGRVLENIDQTVLNEEGKILLNEITSLLVPEAVIYERKAPFEINDKGDLIINFIKPLEQQYQEAHRLLKLYGDKNIEGIKHELARLFYINYRIEKKIKKMNHEDENYKKLIDLRARVLNDFKKYFKIVIEKEPDFDFAKYYQQSEYYDGNIIIDNKIVKATAALIAKFLKSLGL